MSRVPTGGRWQMRFAFADKADKTDVASDAPVHSDAVRVYRDEPPAPLPGEYREGPIRKTRISHPRTRTGLPVAKPLPGAIAAGHFGHEPDGSPIRPSADEVREITASHAETLKDAIQGRRHDDVEHGIGQYAESFGPEAAERLRSYVQHLARVSVAPTWRR